jgi:hypothetical protein
MFIFRRFMAERSIAYVVGFLTLVGTALTLPVIGIYYGLHEWTAALTGGIVDARFIAVIDTALESPLGQVAMIPMLAWTPHGAAMSRSPAMPCNPRAAGWAGLPAEYYPSHTYIPMVSPPHAALSLAGGGFGKREGSGTGLALLYLRQRRVLTVV